MTNREDLVPSVILTQGNRILELEAIVLSLNTRIEELTKEATAAQEWADKSAKEAWDADNHWRND